jgi:hypothetical protein
MAMVMVMDTEAMDKDGDKVVKEDSKVDGEDKEVSKVELKDGEILEAALGLRVKANRVSKGGISRVSKVGINRVKDKAGTSKLVR